MGVGGHVAVVRDHDDGVAGSMQPGKQFEDIVGGDRIQVAGRLIGQQQARARDQCAGHGDALALATGQLGRPVPDALLQADLFQGEPRPLDPFAARNAGIDQRQFDIVQGVGTRRAG